MSQAVSAKTQLLNYEDYLAYDDGTDTLYELANGSASRNPSSIGRK